MKALKGVLPSRFRVVPMLPQAGCDWHGRALLLLLCQLLLTGPGLLVRDPRLAVATCSFTSETVIAQAW